MKTLSLTFQQNEKKNYKPNFFNDRMSSPFENPRELNPFENIKKVPAHIPPPQVLVVERVVQQKSKRHRWLEVPGACCLSYY